MAKGKTNVFFCQCCGYESSKWMGQCPGCKEWNSFVEDDLCDIFSGELCVVEGLLADWDSFFDDVACEVFEFGSRDSARHVEWGAVFNREEGEVDFGFASDA